MNGLSGIDGNEGNFAPDPNDRLDGSGGPIVRPMQVSPSADTIPGLPTGPNVPLVFRGLRWPGTEGSKWPAMPTSEFRAADWDPYRWGVVATAQFAALPTSPGDGTPLWLGLVTKAQVAIDPAWLGPELRELHNLIEYRDGLMAEAVAQRHGIIGFFRGVLDFDVLSHRHTYLLCEAAMSVGQFLALHWKGAFRRARPSRLDPRLMPALDVPGHAAYPSGHALQAMLIALLLEQVLPPEILTADPNAAPLRTLARRIGRNREALGLHYRSDTYFGQMLAARALPLLLRAPWLFGEAGSPTAGPRAVTDLPLAPPGDPRHATFGPQALDFAAVGAFLAGGAIAKARAEWA